MFNCDKKYFSECKCVERYYDNKRCSVSPWCHELFPSREGLLSDLKRDTRGKSRTDSRQHVLTHQSSTQPWMGAPWLNKLILCCAKDIFVTSIFSTTFENKIEEIFLNVFIKTFFKGISGAKTALLLWQDRHCTGSTSKNWQWRTYVMLKTPIFSLSKGEGVRVLCYGSALQHCSGQHFRFLTYRALNYRATSGLHPEMQMGRFGLYWRKPD